jgi:hypothetical protein
MTVFGEISLFEFLNNIRFCLFFLKSMALMRRRGNEKIHNEINLLQLYDSSTIETKS